MSKYFKDYDEFKKIFSALFDKLLSHEKISPSLSKANMIVQFQYTDPEAIITVNLKDSPSYCFGETNLKPDVIFKQSCDFSHSFWHGFENAIAALAKRKITAKGDIPKALKLLPIIKPGFRLYPKVLEELGYQDKILKKDKIKFG